MVRPRTMRNARAGRLEAPPSGSSENAEASDNEGISTNQCPLCMNTFDDTDLSIEPCTCSYRICLWCVHRLRTDGKGCPACRRPYDGQLQDAEPRQLEKKGPQPKLSGAQFFPSGVTVTGNVMGITDGISARLPPAPVRSRSVPATISRNAAGEDPWSHGLDPWSSTKKADSSSATAKAKQKQPPSVKPHLDWWAEHVAAQTEAAAAPWLPPSQGKASRDLFDSEGWAAGLTAQKINSVGPSREEDFETWLQKRKSGKFNSTRENSSRANNLNCSLTQPLPPEQTNQRSAGKSESKASSLSNYGRDINQESGAPPRIAPSSYASAVIGERPCSRQNGASEITSAQCSVWNSRQGDQEQLDLQEPGEGYFVEKRRRGPAIPEGFGPDARGRTSGESTPVATSDARPADAHGDAGLRIRARAALQEAMRSNDLETLRRRLANAEAVGVGHVLIMAARRRMIELSNSDAEAAELGFASQSGGSGSHAIAHGCVGDVALPKQRESSSSSAIAEEDRWDSSYKDWSGWHWHSDWMSSQGWWDGWSQPVYQSSNDLSRRSSQLA